MGNCNCNLNDNPVVLNSNPVTPLRDDTIEFLKKLKGYFDYRRAMDELADKVDSEGLLRRQQLETHSGGIENDDGSFKIEYQQKNVDGQPVGSGGAIALDELFEAAESATPVYHAFLDRLVSNVDGLDSASLNIAPLKLRV